MLCSVDFNLSFFAPLTWSLHLPLTPFVTVKVPINTKQSPAFLVEGCILIELYALIVRACRVRVRARRFRTLKLAGVRRVRGVTARLVVEHVDRLVVHLTLEKMHGGPLRRRGCVSRFTKRRTAEQG